MKRQACCTFRPDAVEIMQKVYLLCTGGTIEKVYLEHSGSVQNIHAKIDRYLQRLRLPDLKVQTLRLMNKDSLEMTDADRDQILCAVRTKLKKPAPIIITQGTDTMIQTGLFLEKNLPHPTVPIILTGAMTPLGFERSDGLQNLTESLLAARILQPGVYLVIHNQVFPIDRVRKDRERARFVWKRARVRSQRLTTPGVVARARNSGGVSGENESRTPESRLRSHG